MLQWYIFVLKRIFGGLKGYVGGKLIESENVPPSYLKHINLAHERHFIRWSLGTGNSRLPIQQVILNRRCTANFSTSVWKMGFTLHRQEDLLGCLSLPLLGYRVNTCDQILCKREIPFLRSTDDRLRRTCHCCFCGRRGLRRSWCRWWRHGGELGATKGEG